MTHEQTMQKLKDMRLHAMAEAWQEQERLDMCAHLSFADRLGLLVDAQWLDRKNGRYQRLVNQARFSNRQASLEDLDYAPDRKLNRQLILELASCNYIKHARNVVIMGATGAGKSYLAQALGRQACAHGLSTRYVTLPDLLDEMHMAQSVSIAEFQKIRKRYARYRLLIIDEWLTFPIDEKGTETLLRLLEQRSYNGSTMVVSQLDPAEWLDSIPLAVAAEAITDRIVSRAHRITIHGDESMRSRIS